MAQDAGTSPEVKTLTENELFKRQTTAGIEGNAALSPDEQKSIIELNAKKFERTSAGTIPPHIVELQKKAANAGIGGNPKLTEDDQKQLAEYYASLKR